MNKEITRNIKRTIENKNIRFAIIQAFMKKLKYLKTWSADCFKQWILLDNTNINMQILVCKNLHENRIDFAR